MADKRVCSKNEKKNDSTCRDDHLRVLRELLKEIKD